MHLQSGGVVAAGAMGLPGKHAARSTSTATGGSTRRNACATGCPLYPIDCSSPTIRSYVRTGRTSQRTRLSPGPSAAPPVRRRRRPGRSSPTMVRTGQRVRGRVDDQHPVPGDRAPMSIATGRPAPAAVTTSTRWSRRPRKSRQWVRCPASLLRERTGHPPRCRTQAPRPDPVDVGVHPQLFSGEQRGPRFRFGQRRVAVGSSSAPAINATDGPHVTPSRWRSRRPPSFIGYQCADAPAAGPIAVGERGPFCVPPAQFLPTGNQLLPAELKV